MQKKKEETQKIEKPKEHKKEERLLEYAWNDVSTWEYDNDVAILYKSDGSLLDKLHLDEVVEDYVNRYTKYQEPQTPETTLFDVSQKEYEFLETLYTRDMDMKLAIGLLNISENDLNTIVNKFLELEMLERVTDSEVKLTQKGILWLMQQIEGRR